MIEVAIVRPGPIQGDMVHPYLRRRSGLEPVAYPSEALRGVLEKTLGVPLFQEQAMQIAIVGAGFTPSESDRLRRAMATFKRVGTIHTFRDKFIDGMVENGYARDFAERCFKQIEGFGTYGFPESHAASFALLVYVSSWLKCHYPEVFACALLNSQPMGFYAPAQIVRDAQGHGVAVLPVDVNASDWDCTLEPEPQAASIGPLASSSCSGSTRVGPVNDLSTVSAPQLTSHAMVGSPCAGLQADRGARIPTIAHSMSRSYRVMVSERLLSQRQSRTLRTARHRARRASRAGAPRSRRALPERASRIPAILGMSMGSNPGMKTGKAAFRDAARCASAFAR